MHIHDLQYPFEYPDELMDKSYSWNEIYAPRAFGSFSNSYLAAVDPGFLMGLLMGLNPTLLKNTGGSIWLEACEPAMESVS